MSTDEVEYVVYANYIGELFCATAPAWDQYTGETYAALTTTLKLIARGLTKTQAELMVKLSKQRD